MKKPRLKMYQKETHHVFTEKNLLATRKESYPSDSYSSFLGYIDPVLPLPH